MTESFKHPRRPRTFAAFPVESLETRRLFATFTVTNLNPTGAGSLNQAVLDANAAAGADVIAFQAGVQGDIDLGASPLVVTDDVDIQGPGFDKLFIIAGGDDAGHNRSFTIHNASADLTVRIAGVAITGGDHDDGGAGLLNDGEDVTLAGVVFDSNATLQGRGGGVLNVGGTMTINGCSFVGNRSDGSLGGGGMFIDGGSVAVSDSVFDSNITSGLGVGGGGVYVGAGSLSVTNSTFSGNSEGNGNGGGAFIAAGASTLMRSVTFSNNSATNNAVDTGAGGGLFVAGNATLENVLLGDNLASGPAGVHDLDRATTGHINASHCLIESMPGGTINGTNTANIVGEDAQLDNLGNNGGSTQTVGLLPGSVAIDAGAPQSDLPTDQRGQPRTVGAAPDIGAYEFDDGSIPVTSQPQIASVSPSPVPGSTVAQTLTIAGTDFNDAATVTLRNVTTGQAVTDFTVTEITATLVTLDAVFGNDPSTWSVEVTNPDTGTTGAFEFEVTSVTPTIVTVGDGQAKSVTFVDADGTSVTLTHKGGTAAVTFAGTNLQATPGKKGTTVSGQNVTIGSVALANTTTRSALTIKTKGGDGRASLNTLTGSTPLGKLSAATTDLSGNGIALTGAGTIGTVQLNTIAHNAEVDLPAANPKGVTFKVNDVQGAIITIGGALKSFTGGDLSGTLSAASIGTVKLSGDLAAEVRTPGAIKSVTAATFSAARILAGLANDASSLPTSLADFVTPTASIGSVSVKAKLAGAFGGGSLIAAPTIGKASLGIVTTANDGDAFGLAVNSANSVTFTVASSGDKPKLSKLEQPSQTFTNADFTVRVL